MRPGSARGGLRLAHGERCPLGLVMQPVVLNRTGSGAISKRPVKIADCAGEAAFYRLRDKTLAASDIWQMADGPDETPADQRVLSRGSWASVMLAILSDAENPPAECHADDKYHQAHDSNPQAALAFETGRERIEDGSNHARPTPGHQR